MLPDPSTSQPSAGRAGDVAISAAIAHPRWVGLGIAILVAFFVVPALLIVAFARLQGARR
ncbi:MAG TPA: hypothetical protein VF649_06525 [Sphingomonas sp.]|jgi:hypothetical protein|uniref:hypothetical protein n=1 Tax=Sphingomonas sp. TaxID=28214 RepID=UPI002EDB4602